MKFEFSAGGIVFNKKNKQIEVLLCQHSQHHGWVFPKGLIGDKKKGEKKEETAVREVEEETGIKAKIVESLSSISYWYVFEGEKIKKTVYYFIMECTGGDISKHDHEMEQVEWLPIKKVEERLSYKSDKEVWKEAKKLIESVF